MSKFSLGLLFIFFTLAKVTCDNKFECIGHIMNMMKEEMGTQRVSLITSSPETCSSTTALIMQKIMNKFPACITKPKALLNQLNDTDTINRKNMILNLNSTSLNIIFIDTCNNTEALKAVFEIFEFLQQVTRKGLRPHCIIFFVNMNHINFKDTFEYLWSLKYLYITIIEIVQPEKCNNQLNALYFIDQRHVLVHHYNPFNDSYEIKPLCENIKLFPDKLKNLHGYRLRALLKTQLSTVPIQEWVTYKTFETISQILNFTITITLNYTYSHDENEIKSALGNETVDFRIDTVNIFNQKNVAFSVIDNQNLMYEIHYIIRQQGYYETNIPWNLIIAVSAVVIIIMIFTIIKYLLTSESKFSTTYNFTLVLIGFSPISTPKTKKEKLLFLCLIFISVAFSAQVLEYLLDMNLNQKKFLNLKSLQDLKDSGINLTTTKRAKEYASKSSYFGLSDRLVASNQNSSNCLALMISNTINVCMDTMTMTKAVTRMLSKPENGWIISYIEEPPINSHSTYALSRYSPYTEKFRTFINWFNEVGISEYWQTNYFNIQMKLKQSKFMDTIKLNINKAANHFYTVREEIHLTKKLMYLLITGYSVSFLVFAFELVCRRLKHSIQNSI